MPVVTRSQARKNKIGSQKTIAEWTAENELREWNARDHRQPLAQRPVLGPSPLKIDFTKVKPRPVSENFVFPKSTEQKLEEALAEVEALKLERSSKNAKIAELATKLTMERKYPMTNNNLLTENETLKAELYLLKKKNENLEWTVKYLSWKEQYGAAVDRCNQLRERISNPFKGAISRPF
jgi:hypothetical protein